MNRGVVKYNNCSLFDSCLISVLLLSNPFLFAAIHFFILENFKLFLPVVTTYFSKKAGTTNDSGLKSLKIGQWFEDVSEHYQSVGVFCNGIQSKMLCIVENSDMPPDIRVYGSSDTE